MPQFVIEREIPGAGKMTPEQLKTAAENSLDVLHELGPEIRWLQSYITDDKIYCVYFSPDEALIREHARGAGIPADRISAVRSLLDADGPHAPPSSPALASGAPG
jgi:hypothetical protein